MEEREQFRAYMKAAGELSGQPRGRCFSEAELTEYHEGAGAPGQRESIQSHLVNCEACRRMLLDISAFFDPPREDETALNRGEVEAEWQRLQPKIAAPKQQRRFPVLMWLPVAASVLLAVVAGWMQVHWRRAENANRQLAARLYAERSRATREIAELRRPRLDGSIHDVFSTEFLQRSGAGGKANAIQAAAGGPVTLILNGAGQPRHAGYALEILDGAGRMLWRGEDLKRGADGNYLIALPAGFLGPGEYRFVILVKAAAYERVAEYAVAVRN